MGPSLLRRHQRMSSMFSESPFGNASAKIDSACRRTSGTRREESGEQKERKETKNHGWNYSAPYATGWRRYAVRCLST